MKRYRLTHETENNGPVYHLQPDECLAGEYVTYADHRAECERMVREAAARVCDETGLAGLLVDADTIVREVMGDGK